MCLQPGTLILSGILSSVCPFEMCLPNTGRSKPHMKLWTCSCHLQLVQAAAVIGMKCSSGPGAPLVHPTEKMSFSLTKHSGCLTCTCTPLLLRWCGEPTCVSAARTFSFVDSTAASCLKVKVRGEQQAGGPPGSVDARRERDWPGETNIGVKDACIYIPTMLMRPLPLFCRWRSIRPKHVIYLFKKTILRKSCLQH